MISIDALIGRAEVLANDVLGAEWGPQAFFVGKSLAMIVIVLVPLLLTVLYY